MSCTQGAVRGLLLEAYAFSKIGQISSGAQSRRLSWLFVLFVLFVFVLVGFGFAHARSTAPEKRMLAPKAKVVPTV